MSSNLVSKADYLNLTADKEVSKMLFASGASKPEEIWFSDFVTKINKRDKEQTRILLITDAALYNVLPDDVSTSKRRIGIETIQRISISAVSDEFVFHIPDEYDYRFKTPKKESVVKIVEYLYRKKCGKKLSVVHLPEADLKNVVITKDAARLLTREDVMRRKAEIVAEAHESDNEEDKKKSSDNEASSWLDGVVETVSLDDFDLLKVIGRGSFGKVMQVRKKDTNKIYAMKILKKETIIARNQVEHTRAERAILQSLQHPFLMGLRFAFQTKEKLYFVLDYYQGGELFFHLKHKRRFSEEEAKIIVSEIASALGFLHGMNVIYRDLKPENILLDEVGHACLTDFGLSKDVSQTNMKAQTFCGTPEYLAPEVVMGIAHGKEIDWWSLGILLYELTVGIPPFYSQEVTEMYEKIQHGNLRFPPFLSAECRSLIQGLLVRDPSKRLGFGSADINSIKTHPFFASINWDRLLKKEVIPVYIPIVKQGVMDTSNFDQQFTSEPVVDSVVQGSKLNEMSNEFNGFTFVPKTGPLQGGQTATSSKGSMYN